jgi:aryl-alcohol dehydrogenase-like predicted oxidoreductase
MTPRFDPPRFRLGLGLAAVGRPAYITLGRANDLGENRSVEAMYAGASTVLDAAWDAGVRYLDAARSYGLAEDFLARWLAARNLPLASATIGSKWGYRYTAGWKIDAPVHEQKEHTVERFRSQLAESKALLGDRLALYQIHSATLESGALDDERLLAALVAEREARSYGALGVTLSGPGSAATLARALEAAVAGVRVFDVVQATFNVLEPSLAADLAAAHAGGVRVIAKEVFANGRLSPANLRSEDARLVTTLTAAATTAGLGIDQLAVAWVLSHPFVDLALSGAATPAQVRSHAAAVDRPLPPGMRETLGGLAEPSERYWSTRGALPWA